MVEPQIVCAGCGCPTNAFKPLCEDCLEVLDEIGTKVCLLCDQGMLKDANGLHFTKTGGYAGKCGLK
jgi:hypothetical protein